jgi:hypothetical protein
LRLAGRLDYVRAISDEYANSFSSICYTGIPRVSCV